MLGSGHLEHVPLRRDRNDHAHLQDCPRILWREASGKGRFRRRARRSCGRLYPLFDRQTSPRDGGDGILRARTDLLLVAVDADAAGRSPEIRAVARRRPVSASLRPAVRSMPALWVQPIEARPRRPPFSPGSGMSGRSPVRGSSALPPCSRSTRRRAHGLSSAALQTRRLPGAGRVSADPAACHAVAGLDLRQSARHRGRLRQECRGTRRTAAARLRFRRSRHA